MILPGNRRLTGMECLLLVVAGALAGLALLSCGTGTASIAGVGGQPPPQSPTEHLTHFHFFSPQSLWNRPVRDNAPLDPNSAALINALAGEAFREVGTGEGPYISTSPYSVPIYRVSVDQPTVFVRLVGHSNAPALQAAWRAVPLPPNAIPAAGTDGHLVVWQPGTDRLWEFWRLAHTGEGWQASWGGAIKNVSSSPGVYNQSSWPGSQPWWGASSSSLSIAGGVITFEDLAHREINHALTMSLPYTRADVYASPARRTDGKTFDPSALPEGAHLQLNPRLDLSTLRMSPMTRMIARAAQHYGIFVKAIAGDITFYGQDPTPTGTDPYTGPNGYYGGRTPVELLAQFPWHHLRLLKMKLHRMRSR